MIALLNFVVPVVVIALIILAMRLKKFWPIIVSIVFVIVYQAVQPSYLPKGTTKQLPNAEFQIESKPIEDRIRKTISPEERDARMANVENETNERIEALIERSKSEKE